MKLAFPSDDQLNICAHFGKTKGFKIFEISDDKQIVSEAYIANNLTTHGITEQAKVPQDTPDLHVHSHDHNHNHSHSKIINALHDCKAVIAGGMGRRLYVDFEAAKIEVFVTKEKNIRTALDAYLNQTLDNNSDSCCEH